MNYLIQVGIAFDMMLNALLGGDAGQTLSYRAALGMDAKKPIWCVLCRFLSWLVQRDHCQDQLAGIPMDTEQYFRAFIGLVLLASILFLPAFWLWHFL